MQVVKQQHVLQLNMHAKVECIHGMKGSHNLTLHMICRDQLSIKHGTRTQQSSASPTSDPAKPTGFRINNEAV